MNRGERDERAKDGKGAHADVVENHAKQRYGQRVESGGSGRRRGGIMVAGAKGVGVVVVFFLYF